MKSHVIQIHSGSIVFVDENKDGHKKDSKNCEEENEPLKMIPNKTPAAEAQHLLLSAKHQLFLVLFHCTCC